MEWMLMPYRRYFDFAGRSRRMEYWMFQLFIMIVYLAWLALAVVMGGGMDVESGMAGGFLLILLVAFALLTFIPNLAVTIRRLHDTNRSGWWILISFIPLAGLILLYFAFLEGTNGPNDYGPDPKEGLTRGV